MHEHVKVIRKVATRLPTAHGLYTLYYYENNQDNKEHLALVMGEIASNKSVLLRIHSECFTGDVLSSRRCDCGYQLEQAMRVIEQEQKGIIIYLRQEGRGIGLLAKLKAYNLQDQGLDTVEANLRLGHQVDERDYSLAGAILKDLDVKSVRLMTNNPHKLRDLIHCGITVESRLPLESPVHEDNFRYLHTKKFKMKHLLMSKNLQPLQSIPENDVKDNIQPTPARPALSSKQAHHLIHITVSYAQSIDGCIALKNKEPLALSSPAAQELTHYLRSQHDAILVGIGTILTDNPRLTVRLITGRNPQPVILDTWLKMPGTANLFHHPTHKPLIFCSPTADPERKKALEKAGAHIQPVSLDQNNLLVLNDVFSYLKNIGIQSLMVEGGSQVITNFLSAQVVDELIITLVPQIIGGLNAIVELPAPLAGTLPSFKKVTYQKLNEEIIIKGVLNKS